MMNIVMEMASNHPQHVFAARKAYLAALLLALALAALPAAAQAPQSPDPAAPVLALVTRAEQKTKSLAVKLESCRAAGKDIALPDASLAVAELFCRYSRADAAQPALREAALKSMAYVDQMLDTELRKADDVLAGRAAYPVIPAWRSAVGATWHDGVFWSGGEPLFLSGFNWDATEARQNPALLKSIGVNLVDGSLSGAMNQGGSFSDGQTAGQVDYLRQMATAGFAVDEMLGVNPPRWLLGATPGLTQRGYGNGINFLFEHPQVAAYREKLLDHIIPLAAAQPSLFAIDLYNEPAFQGPSPLMMENWRAWLKKKYGDVAALNRAWGTSLTSLTQITRFPSQPARMNGQWDRGPVDFSKPGMRGMHYDWCEFNNERVSAYFGSISDRIHSRAPRVATHVKVMMGNYFVGGTEPRGWKMDLTYHTFGLDPEALAASCSLLGCDVDLCNLSDVAKLNRYQGSVPYVMNWITAGLTADFMKSLAPGKPFYNSEFHVTEDDKVPAPPADARGHIETALWLAHLHGMSANITWYWSRVESGAPAGAEWFRGSMLQQPWMLEGYARETLNLRRFVQPVMSFARQPRPVRLLYSEASAIQDVQYIDALRDAYEALNFLGVSIGLVTEKQLAAGLPEGTRLIVVPNARYVQDATVTALQGARAGGVTVGLIGEGSLGAVPTGARRADSRMSGADLIPLATPQDYQPRLEAWLKAAGVERELLALDSAGRPAWGVEVRTAREGDRRLAYLVNLMREPVKVTLRWRAADARLRDWRTDEPVANALTLQPRQLIFGGY